MKFKYYPKFTVFFILFYVVTAQLDRALEDPEQWWRWVGLVLVPVAILLFIHTIAETAYERGRFEGMKAMKGKK